MAIADACVQAAGTANGRVSRHNCALACGLRRTGHHRLMTQSNRLIDRSWGGLVPSGRLLQGFGGGDEADGGQNRGFGHHQFEPMGALAGVGPCTG